MADLGLPSPQDLSSIYGAWNPETYLQGRSQVGMQQQGAQLSLEDQMRKLNQSKQMDPMLLEQQRLQNQTTSAQLPGVIGQSQSQVAKGNVDTATQDSAIKAKLSEHLKSMSDNDIAMTENSLQQMAFSDDPAIRQQGVSKMALFKDVLKEREKQRYIGDRALELEAARAKSAEKVANINASSRLAVKGAGSKVVGDVFGQIASGKIKGAKNIHAALVAGASTLPDDDPQKQMMLQAAESIRPQAEAEIATPRPGSIDAGAVANMPTNKGPSIAPANAPAKAPPPLGGSLAAVQAQYPGVPPEKLREAYKKKFGVDLK